VCASQALRGKIGVTFGIMCVVSRQVKAVWGTTQVALAHELISGSYPFGSPPEHCRQQAVVERLYLWSKHSVCESLADFVFLAGLVGMDTWRDGIVAFNQGGA